MKKVDLFWLVDATGSMGTCIENLKSSISKTWSPLREQGFDVAQGVGYYRDMHVESGIQGYDVIQEITENSTFLQNSVNRLMATGGGDAPESQVYALTQIAENPLSVAWREDASKIILWAGDIYGHKDEIVDGVTYTTNKAIEELMSHHIVVFAFSMAPADMLNYSDNSKYVAAFEIAIPTGGHVYRHVDQSNLVQYVIDALLGQTNVLELTSRIKDEILEEA